jgi:hypothetical protein
MGFKVKRDVRKQKGIFEKKEFNSFWVVILILKCLFYPWVSPMPFHSSVFSGSEKGEG